MGNKKQRWRLVKSAAWCMQQWWLEEYKQKTVKRSIRPLPLLDTPGWVWILAKKEGNKPRAAYEPGYALGNGG
jgi:hypothetical protein